MNVNMEIKTSDIWFAAYLMHEGGKLTGLEQGKKGRKLFKVTYDGGDFGVDSAKYYGGDARVEPKRLRHMLSDLRGLLSTRVSLPNKPKEIVDGTPSTERS